MVDIFLGRARNGEAIQIANNDDRLFARHQLVHRLLRIGDGDGEAGDGRIRRRGFDALLLGERRGKDPCRREKNGENGFCGMGGFYLHGRKLTAPVHCLAMKFNA